MADKLKLFFGVRKETLQPSIAAFTLGINYNRFGKALLGVTAILLFSVFTELRFSLPPQK